MATCPGGGRAGDTEAGLALAGAQGHLRPRAQGDAFAIVCTSQEPFQVGGIVGHKQSQVQLVTWQLRLGVQGQVPGHCGGGGQGWRGNARLSCG